MIQRDVRLACVFAALAVAAAACGKSNPDATDASAAAGDASAGDTGGGDAATPAYCAADPWQGLEACGWPGPANTGPDLSQCPGGALAVMGSSATPTAIFEIAQDGTAIECRKIYGGLHVTASNVTIRNSSIEYTSGKTGTAANATAPIFVDDGASATIDHVELDGRDGAHACIWHQGAAMTAHHVNCHGVDDGVFAWADTGFSPASGDHVTIDHSYFHDFTTATSNGHEDGFQTEGAGEGLIQHNTFALTTEADSAIAIWNSLKSSTGIVIDDNLMTGGGFTVYAEDYSPNEASPADPGAPVGGFTVTNVELTNNKFSTRASACVGQYGVWFYRAAWPPYEGGPSDGWHRSGNTVIETGETVDGGNPHAGTVLCN